jgi:DnaJ-class molecular chaperone
MNTDALKTACEYMVRCIVDCEQCDASGIEPGTKGDACYYCGGVGKDLNGDAIFAAFAAKEALNRKES